MPHLPPRQTFASRQFARVAPMGEARSRPGSWALAVAMAAITLLFQYAMPPFASVTFLYLLLAAQSVWFLGGRAGVILTSSAVVAGGVLAAHDAQAGPAIAIALWNGLSRLLAVWLVGFVLAGLRGALEVEHWRASTDHLTGALNRAAFEEKIGPTLRAAEAKGEAVVLAYMDLDGFKNVNDIHGHAAGNGVLAIFARAAQGAMRATDTFARIGGDEFVALIRVPSAVAGDRVAEMLHYRLSAILAGSGHAVTCSMGALVMDARHMAREPAILDQADRLMYLAKQSGKDALHIGRGEAREALLRTAFPRKQAAPATIPLRLAIPTRPAP